MISAIGDIAHSVLLHQREGRSETASSKVMEHDDGYGKGSNGAICGTLSAFGLPKR
jgi:hypothetical protein